jgi:hypothetical protein
MLIKICSGKQFANKYGWQYNDLMNCTLYGPYQKRKSRLIEKIDEEGKPEYSVVAICFQRCPQTLKSCENPSKKVCL